jgi:hypothetical protein
MWEPRQTYGPSRPVTGIALTPDVVYFLFALVSDLFFTCDFLKIYLSNKSVYHIYYDNPANIFSDRCTII